MAYLVDRVVTGQEMDREKNSSRSGKSQEILFWVRENWHFEEKLGKIELQFHIPSMAERNISGRCDLSFFLSHCFVKTIVEMP